MKSVYRRTNVPYDFRRLLSIAYPADLLVPKVIGSICLIANRFPEEAEIGLFSPPAISNGEVGVVAWHFRQQ